MTADTPPPSTLRGDAPRSARPAGDPDDHTGGVSAADGSAAPAVRDLADVPAVEVTTKAAVLLMSAAADKLGLGAEDPAAAVVDLDESRRLITALAGLVTAAAPDLGVHAASLRDGLRALQLAFREASRFPDAPGDGPGERLTGPVYG